MPRDTVWSDRDTVRVLLARHLVGSGVEIGPGHFAFPTPFAGTTVAYADRWDSAENRELFPELGPAAPFPEPQYVCNLDVDRLKLLSDQSQDFVIASHVFEHVAEPIGLLVDVHRVLRPGGTLLLLLPDRHLTFDQGRQPTTLEHLVDEYERGVTEVDDDHIRDFMSTGEPEVHAQLPDLDEADRSAIFDRHRRRSIHVHCWDAGEFFTVLLHATRDLGMAWEFVDGVLPYDEGPEGVEFGWVLRRPIAAITPAVAAERLQATWRAWRHDREAALEVARQLASPANGSPVAGIGRRLRDRAARPGATGAVLRAGRDLRRRITRSRPH